MQMKCRHTPATYSLLFLSFQNTFLAEVYFLKQKGIHNKLRHKITKTDYGLYYECVELTYYLHTSQPIVLAEFFHISVSLQILTDNFTSFFFCNFMIKYKSI